MMAPLDGDFTVARAARPNGVRDRDVRRSLENSAHGDGLARPPIGSQIRMPPQAAVRDETIGSMSRRDLVHVLGALWDLSSGDSAVGVPVAAIDEAIGRGHGDMRTPLNLQSLSDEGLVALHVDGRWGLTPQGVAWIQQDRELSGQ